MNKPETIGPETIGIVQVHDFTSRFSPEERKFVAATLNDHGCLEVLHMVTNEGNADVFLFSLQHQGPLFTIGKGAGKFFLALLGSGEVLETSNGLTKVLDHLPAPIIEELEEEE